MREQDLQKLEFHKVKEKLKEFTNSPATNEVIENLSPMTSLEEINSEIELFNSFTQVDGLTLYNFEDIRELLKRSRIEGASLSVEELLKLQNTLKLIKEVRKVIGSEAENKVPLRRLSRRLHLFSSLENLIESTIDRRGFVKDEASEELFNLRKSIRGLEKEIMDRLESLLRRPDADKVFTDRIITLRNNRYVVPVKSSQVKKIFGIIHGTSSSGYTTYVEPQFVIQLNNKLTELKAREEEETIKVLRRITSYVGDFAPKIEESFETLVKIDLLQAKRKFAEAIGGKFPQLAGHIELKEVKHPILALINPDTVPVNIVIKEKKGLILTGPNTGGKTVALKTLGLVTLMVQSAIPVPVQEGSILRVFQRVFADIGDEQSIEQNLSTFSSHMTNIAQFLPNSDENTLVLLDELGAGTDPVEGSALGIGILEYLKKRGAWVFANTHHTPIKVYAVNSDYFVPGSVLFDRETLKPLYKIAYNTIGESMAFEVASRCGIPEEVIEIAKSSIKAEGREYMSAMEKLSDYTREYEEKLEELENLKEELSKEKEKYEELYREYMEFKRRGWKEAYKEAKEYLRKLINEGQEVLKKAKTKEELEDFIREQEKQLKLFMPREEKEEIKVGDMVEFMGKKGRVSQIKEGKAYVNLEGMRIWIDIDSLIKLKKTPGKKEPQVPKGTLARTEINLIGMDANTALLELEKFIEEAYAAGHKSVRVVHGIGKGVLKQVVHEFLSKSDKVRFYREAYPKEGGSGVTMVYLNVQ
ncbi:DNA mismatch repair protein MutS2 [Hydrogenivirga caldilitoris]|uniref:Endonuclease MutS2 n=1 Tax=Hydrogenivirga caldilitoris TaxID=246264 RepID=A0A497XNQ9_9AQUI|nr:endonuclease MutS2 [Hydrogenivirga caldilitoris]RLJ70577.1 DNA mismatch repair protein MutS2 [Hydrogenivirga caldilitoris]